MPILFLFALLSGLLTILSPCIWPLLPIVLSSAQKPKRLILGLTLSFFLSTLLLSTIVKIIPINATYLRYLAIAVIALSGLSLLIPKLAAAMEVGMSRLTSRFSPKGNGGLLTGIALGLVWAPCAGPILATVIALAATQKLSLDSILVLASYTVGVGLSLWIFTLVGRRLVKNTRTIQQLFGVVILVIAVGMVFNYDQLVGAKLVSLFPGYTSLTTKLESVPLPKVSLPTLGNAPEFTGITNWLNSQPLTMQGLSGKVVLIDFWTYTCINCIRTLPYVTSWYEKYKDQGLVIVGVHTPEFEFEKDASNVRNALTQYRITYPVAQDNNYATWTAYHNQYWPAHYLIDANGKIRYTHFGEGKYEETEMKIRELLEEAGRTVTSTVSAMPDTFPARRVTPETYLGTERGGDSHVRLNSAWKHTPQYIQSDSGATLDLEFTAQKVFLVITPKNNESIKVYLDDKLHSEITLDEPRLYQLLDLPTIESHSLRLEMSEPGTQLFAFTFG